MRATSNYFKQETLEHPITIPQHECRIALSRSPHGCPDQEFYTLQSQP